MISTHSATPHSGRALALSSTDIAQLVRASELLLSPLDYSSVDEWRSAVNRHLSKLLHADSAGFLLPVQDGLMLYSEEHDPQELARYQDYPPPPLIDGTSLWEQMLRSRVGTLAHVYGERYDIYTQSTYYQEYAGANGAHDTLAAATSLGGVDARGMACMHFWHERPDGRLFGEREVALLELLYPAFRAGAEAQFQWGQHRSTLLDTLDALGQAVLIADVAGRVLHQTPALSDALVLDAEGPLLRAEMLALLSKVRATAIDAAPRAVASAAVVTEVSTGFAAYVLRASLYRAAGSSTPLILIALERRSPLPRPSAELQSAYGLTRQEVRVARLIAQGRANAQIADELCISNHTARRHTERVFQKLNVRSRAEVPAKMFC